MPHYRLLLSLLLFCSPAVQWAQDSDIFPGARREELRKEIVFEPPEVPEVEPTTDSAAPAWDLAAYRQPLLLAISALVVAGLGFLLYRIYRDLSIKNRRPDGGAAPFTTVDLERYTEEELVESGVAPNLLERAEAAGQYAIAVRLAYLGLLHGLTRAGLIRYRGDLTNRNYLEQLAGHPLREDFEAVTHLYERYWYGSHPIDRLSYRVVQQSVAGLHARLPQVDQPIGADE